LRNKVRITKVIAHSGFPEFTVAPVIRRGSLSDEHSGFLGLYGHSGIQEEKRLGSWGFAAMDF
jgi:hypothetical protein